MNDKRIQLDRMETTVGFNELIYTFIRKTTCNQYDITLIDY